MVQKLVTMLCICCASVFGADPAVGTWKLNVAKSTYSPGPPQQSSTITYEETSDGMKRTSEAVDATGKKTSMSYVAKYDGKDYPVTGSEISDSIALRKINDRTVAATLKKGGKVIGTARRVVSSDGKVMTITLNGTDAQGRKVHQVTVFDKM